jgi:hypothetical protein
VLYALAVLVYVGAWAAVLLTPLADLTLLAVVVVAAASVGAGAVARAWSIVALSLVILPLAVAQPCKLECDTSALLHAIVLWTPASAVLLAAGVAAGLRSR